MNTFLHSLALPILAFGLSAWAAQPAATDPIKIGQVVTLTGAGAPWGIPENNALKDEIARINAHGGILGRKVQLIAYDYKGDQLEAINVTKRLIGDGVAGIIGPGSSGSAIAMAPVTDVAGMPFIATGATNPKVTVNFGTRKAIRTAFRSNLIDPFLGPAAARFALTDLKLKTCSVIVDIGSEFSLGLDQYFREFFVKNGGRIVGRESFRSGELDFRAILGKIKAQNPDMVYMPVDMSATAMLVKQGRGLGMKSVFFGSSADTPDFPRLAGQAAEGCYVTGLASTQDPAISKWIDDYTRAYGAVPILPNCVLAVDAMRMYEAAITAAKGTDPGKIIAALERLKNVPTLTGHITMNPGTHDPVDMSCVVEVIKDGKIRFIRRISKLD
jgi:branched-chain amino acid transport system substrate-binding protein